MCSTSIVKLAEFDRHWPSELRQQLHTSPAQWMQQNVRGEVLKSWYGGDYEPACMNNPDWRTYQKYVLRLQLDAGMDGIFFDNPTVHPDGCYCPYCMQAFQRFLAVRQMTVSDSSVEGLRRTAVARKKDFLHFRTTIARDFIADMRNFARTLNPKALITANNSLNSPTVLYSQARTYGYSIYEMSKAEDLVVVEDMLSQPRVDSSGKIYEYGPTYRQLEAISHGKPVVAVTIAQADYHTPPNLVRLALAEAAAHGASYLSWPTWPANERQRMIHTIAPQERFLREHADWLNNAEPVADTVLFLPYFRFLESDRCAASQLAAKLTRANIQYRVICEDNFDRDHLEPLGRQKGTLILEDRAVLDSREKTVLADFEKFGGRVITADRPSWDNWIRALGRAVKIDAPSTVRVVARRQPGRTILHVYNLNVMRKTSFEDEVWPARDVKLICRLPGQKVARVTAYSADEQASVGSIAFESNGSGTNSDLTFRLPKLFLSTIAVIEYSNRPDAAAGTRRNLSPGGSPSPEGSR